MRLVEQVRNALRSYWGWGAGDAQYKSLFGSGLSASGEPISEYLALNLSAVWAAVTVIAGSIASLPLIHYRKTGRGKARYEESRLYKVLHDQFNPEMTAMKGRETMQQHVLLWGNAYAEIQRDGAGRVSALWPITPDRVLPDRSASGALVYQVRAQDGTTTTLPASEMFHLRGLSYDGIVGYSVVRKARESMGGALAAERFVNTAYANGSWFGGAIQHPRALGEKALQHIRDGIEARHKGASKAGGVLILEEGMTWVNTSMSLKDAEFLSARKFSVTEVARWFNIPPDKLRDLEHATYANIEAQAIDFVVNTLRPWLVNWEAECNQKLIPALESRQQFCEHLVDALLRGDTTARYQAYNVGRQGGWLSVNDIREFENMNPLPADVGDVYLIPMNMVPANRIDELIDAQVAPDPAPVVAAAPAPDPAAADRVAALAADLLASVLGREARLAALAPALHALLEDTWRRECQFEADRARKAAGTPEKWAGWLETFYATRVDTATAHLLPTMRVYGAVAGRPPAQLDAELRARVALEAARAQAALAALPVGPTLAAEVETLTAQWSQARPAALAAELIGEVYA